jgi:hypothetical protein
VSASRFGLGWQSAAATSLAPFSTSSFSRAGRLAFWLDPISTLTSGARATRSGWLTMIAGCGPAWAKAGAAWSGQILWQTKRSPDFNKGSMILADGPILASDGAKSLYLVEPNPSEFKQLDALARLNS